MPIDTSPASSLEVEATEQHKDLHSVIHCWLESLKGRGGVMVVLRPGDMAVVSRGEGGRLWSVVHEIGNRRCRPCKLLLLQLPPFQHPAIKHATEPGTCRKLDF